MSFAYMPFFTGDYLRDTRHLTMSEHGCYVLLLMHCWDQKGPVPLDERKILGICNARSGDEIEAMRRVISEFFVRMSDGYYNTRMQTEIERSEILSRSRSEAGRKGYQARAKQLPNKSKAIDKQEHLTPSPSPSLSSSPPPQSNTLGRQADRFSDWWAIYPRKRGKAAAQRKWKAKGLDDKADALIADAKNRKVNDGRWIAGYIPDPLTYLNQERWLDELDLRTDGQSPVAYVKP